MVYCEIEGLTTDTETTEEEMTVMKDGIKRFVL